MDNTSNVLSITFLVINAAITAHAHDVLVVVIVRDAVHIHREGQRLILSDGRRCRELHTLHTEI